MQYSVIYPVGPRFQALAPAMCPGMTPQGQSYQSRGKVAGGPIRPISAPNPGLPTGLTALAQMGQSRSGNAPNVIYPSQYWEADMNEFAPITAHLPGPNIMPIPAERPANVIAAQPFAARIGGDRQIFQPQVVPVWYGTAGTVYG